MKYVCELCGTVYDEQIGDPKHKVRPGTAFSDLPDYYECPTCGSEKEAFSPIRPPHSTSGREGNGYWHKLKYQAEKSESDR